MSKLAEAIEANIPKSAKSDCPVCVLLRTLPKDQAGELGEYLASDPKLIPSSSIRRGLASLGHSVPKDRMLEHRRGGCGK